MSALATLPWNNNSEGGLENKTQANTFSLIKEVFKLYLLTASFPSPPTLSQTPEFTPFLSFTGYYVPMVASMERQLHFPLKYLWMAIQSICFTLQLRNQFWLDSVIPLQKSKRTPLPEDTPRGVIAAFPFNCLCLERQCSRQLVLVGSQYIEEKCPGAHCYWGEPWRLKRNNEYIFLFWITHCNEKNSIASWGKVISKNVYYDYFQFLSCCKFPFPIQHLILIH